MPWTCLRTMVLSQRHKRTILIFDMPAGPLFVHAKQKGFEYLLLYHCNIY